LIAGEAGKLKNQLELERRCEELSLELAKANKRIAELEDELTRGGRSMRMSELVIDQSEKMKEINENLLLEINMLHKENSYLKELTHQESVENLKKELFILKQQIPHKEGSEETNKYAEELYILQKNLENTR